MVFVQNNNDFVVGDVEKEIEEGTLWISLFVILLYCDWSVELVLYSIWCSMG